MIRIGLGTFQLESFNKEILSNLGQSLQEKLPVEVEWWKYGVFKGRQVPRAEANFCQLSLNGYVFLRARGKNVVICTYKLTQEEDVLIQEALKEANLVTPPSWLFPISLSSLHVLFLFIGLIAGAASRHPQEQAVAVLCVVSLVLIPLGMFLFYKTLSSKGWKGVVAKVMLFAGLLATLPASALHFNLLKKLRQKHLYRVLYGDS